MRKGSVSVSTESNSDIEEVIPTHHTAFFTQSGSLLQMTSKEANTDFMLLAGAALEEPVAAQGSMVMNFPDEINQAYRDYQMGFFGRPWPHTLSRQDWLTHVQQNPSAYRAEEAQEEVEKNETSFFE